MIQRRDLLTLLNSIYDTSIKDFGPNGLQVEGCEQIEKIACGVTADLTTIESAIDAGCQALIVHHGLFWNQSNLTLTGALKKRIQYLFEKEISLFAYHLPMDAHPVIGNNYKVALDLGWKDLIPSKDDLGVIGSIESIEPETFYDEIKDYYGSDLFIVKGCKKPFEKVGLISGGGHKYLESMVDAGVDCFISGTADEPTYSQAIENGISFIRVGHTLSEKVGPKALQEHLYKEHKLDAIYIDTDNPF